MYKRFTALFLCIILLTSSFVGCSKNVNAEPVNKENFRVTAYIRGDYVQSEDSLNGEDFDIITHVILFECASFDNEGQVIVEKDKLNTALKNIRKAIGDRDVKISLNLLGPGSITESEVWEKQMDSQSNEHNKAFKSGVLEKNIVAVLDEYGFDGVHFDYEYPLSSKAWRHYNKFLISLDESLGEYTLGVAFSDWNNRFTKKVAESVDTFELMSYDYVDENGKHATFEDTVKLLENTNFKKIPKEKINVGLPFYSRPTDMDAYWYGYNGYYESIDKDGWYHCPEINKDFWFNTPEIIEKKTEYSLNNGYGGVMVWHYNCDLPSTEEDSLFRAIGKVIK